MSDESKSSIIDQRSIITAAIAFFISLYIFFTTTAEFWFSLAAAFLTGNLVWLSYVMVRWLFLALKK